ncbi:DUF2550 family protein [Calidifontibacter terrae]
MGEFLVSAEVLLAALVVCCVLLIGWIVLRRMLITRDHLMILMAQRRGDLWVMGMARSTAQTVEWFPVLGIGLKPRRVLRRREVEVGPPLPVHGVPGVISDPVQVEVQADDTTWAFALSRGDYTQLRSWSESSPPGSTTTVI